MSEGKPKIVLDYDGELMGTVERNEYEETRVYVRESKKGGHYVEIRRWKHLKNYDGPAKQGVGMHKDEVEKVAGLILEGMSRAEILDNDFTASGKE